MELKIDILPTSSRQVAEGHLKLALVLDITPGRLADAIHHVELSIASVEARLAELRGGTQTHVDASSSLSSSSGSGSADIKGKGKMKKLIRDPAVSDMTPSQVEQEIKDLEGMKQELLLKVSRCLYSPFTSLTHHPIITAGRNQSHSRRRIRFRFGIQRRDGRVDSSGASCVGSR